MKYQIRTALGLSEAEFSNTVDWVLGTLQGSGASPCLWLAIMCILLGALDRRSKGLVFCNPRRTSTLRRTADAYVDDTELFVTLQNADLATLAVEMQSTAQFWEQLLFTTGGALALEKCFFVAMDWVFENDTYRPRKMSEQQLHISLTSGGNYTTHTRIHQRNPSEGPRNLGVMLAPDGNNSHDCTALCTKGSTLSRNIVASPLSRGKVRTAYSLMLWPSMKYALGATTFLVVDGAKIDNSCLPTFLSRMGINRNTKQILLFGPPLLGALGFTNTYTDQGICQIQAFIGHIRLNQDIGCLLLILLEHFQLIIGLEEHLFTYPYSHVSQYCDPTWFTSLWQFVDSIQGTVHLDQRWHLHVQRQFDSFIMEELLLLASRLQHTRKKLTAKGLRQLNACRLFLQVLTVADIADGTGTMICPNVLQGMRHIDRRSLYGWPEQASPSKQAWRLWRSCLQQALCTGKKLTTPLGSWLHPEPLHQSWSWFVNPKSSTLVHRHSESGIFQVYGPGRTPRMFQSEFTIRFSRPKTLLPISIIFRG